MIVFNLIKVIKPLRIINNCLFCFPLHSACHMLSNWTAFATNLSSLLGPQCDSRDLLLDPLGSPHQQAALEDLLIQKKDPDRRTVIGWSAWIRTIRRWRDCQDTCGALLPSKARWGSRFLLLYSNHRRIPGDPTLSRRPLLSTIW